MRILLLLICLASVCIAQENTAKVIILTDEEAAELRHLKREWNLAIERIRAKYVTEPGWDHGFNFRPDFQAATPATDSACSISIPDPPRDLIGHPDYDNHHSN